MKRGRKRKRININFVQSFLNRDISSLASLARKRQCSEAHLQDVMGKSREVFIQKTTWPHIPQGDLVMIADAVVEMVEKRWHTVYLMLVRSVRGKKAVILSPFTMSGTETQRGWRAAMDTLPPRVACRIRALVCDGHGGLVNEARWRRWILQRCHFHLLARIQSRRSRFRIARNKPEATAIFENVHTVLSSINSSTINPALSILEEISWRSTSPEIRKVLSGFVRNYQDYRSYLSHPKLRLPTTNNTAESLASAIADLKHRMRGFPTLRSFKQWIVALLKFKKRIACNGFHQQN